MSPWKVFPFLGNIYAGVWFKNPQIPKMSFCTTRLNLKAISLFLFLQFQNLLHEIELGDLVVNYLKSLEGGNNFLN